MQWWNVTKFGIYTFDLMQLHTLPQISRHSDLDYFSVCDILKDLVFLMFLQKFYLNKLKRLLD